jgi:hypothetical protein
LGFEFWVLSHRAASAWLSLALKPTQNAKSQNAKPKTQNSKRKTVSPPYLYPLFSVEFVGVEKLAMPDTVFVYELDNLHIKATVLGYLYESFLSPPLDGVDAISSLTDSQGGLGDIVQSGLTSCDLLDLHEQIQSSQLNREIEDGVSHKNLVIEIYDVEPNYEVCTKQLLNQIVDSLFRIDPILGQIRTIGDSKRHSHVSLSFPTADIVRGALSFQIEVNNVHRN